jgi:hypothetical protein
MRGARQRNAGVTGLGCDVCVLCGRVREEQKKLREQRETSLQKRLAKEAAEAQKSKDDVAEALAARRAAKVGHQSRRTREPRICRDRG